MEIVKYTNMICSRRKGVYRVSSSQGCASSVRFQTNHMNVMLLEASLWCLWRASFVMFLIAAVEETGGDSWKYSLRVSIMKEKLMGRVSTVKRKFDGEGEY